MLMQESQLMPLIYLAKVKSIQFSYQNQFQYVLKLTIFVICETSEDNMQEKMRPII